MKSSYTEGTVSIKFTFKKYDFYINEIKVDANNGVEPIAYYKVNGNNLISGNYFDMLKRQIMKIFNEQIMNPVLGMYRWDCISQKVKKE